ncbi:hypothetical protein [Curtobacterium sp. MCBA15_008]|jgi:hypothetical protein|uniref:hypothetical protein n=1 Tax=Curtobacterium sp. MCBA15_008 TaxID=1898736 RepID=UPI0015871788|nr:hypothetical protein [Curtobacterium sp. MCBA15_008]
MRDTITLEMLRAHPTEWRRRGLTPPAELDAMVAARVANTPGSRLPVDPSYADFFAGA